MNLNQKELVLLPYPFSNLEELKLRPALVVSSNYYNKNSSDCVLVPLTSVIKDEPYSIIIGSKDLRAGKLLKQSRIRADKLFNIERKMIKMKIGILNDFVFDKVKSEILSLFD